MAACPAAAFQKTFNYDSTLSLRIFPPLEEVLGSPTVSLLKYREQISVVTAGGDV